MRKPKMTYSDVRSFDLFFNGNGNVAKLAKMLEDVQAQFDNAESAGAKYYWAKIKGRLSLVAEVVSDSLRVCNTELNLIKKSKRKA